MPVLPYDWFQWRVRRPEFEQCGKLADARVDRGLAPECAGTRSGHY